MAKPARKAASLPKDLLEELVDSNHILYDQGVVDAFGHISTRHPSRAGHFLMSRAIAPKLVRAKDIMEFDAQGEPVDQRGREVYIERFIHSEIYKRRADVNAVVHSHSRGVIPFGITQVKLRPVFHNGSFLYSGVPVFDIRDVAGDSTDLLIRDNRLGQALAESLGDNAVVLMRGHGDAVVGATLHAAVIRAIYTEENARVQAQALSFGSPINYLSDGEGATMEKRSRGGSPRVWDMLKSRVAKR
jgi:HCOMODA/2-hydroxy-3-carboxy-muconic semialdehyde decarboxylase